MSDDTMVETLAELDAKLAETGALISNVLEQFNALAVRGSSRRAIELFQAHTGGRERLLQEIARRMVGVGFGPIVADAAIAGHAGQAAQRHEGTDFCEDLPARWAKRLQAAG